MTFGNNLYSVNLCDTAAQAMYKQLRKLCYTEACIFVLCFSVTDAQSFTNIQAQWIPEIQANATRMILVGCKCDAAPQQRQVSVQQAQQFCLQHHIAEYVECSALNMHQVHLVVQRALAVHEANTSTMAKASRCHIV